jgi:hypothetical protein
LILSRFSYKALPYLNRGMRPHKEMQPTSNREFSQGSYQKSSALKLLPANAAPVATILFWLQSILSKQPIPIVEIIVERLLDIGDKTWI